MGRQRKFTKNQEEDILHTYCNGDTFSEIAREYGVQRQVVYTTLMRIADMDDHICHTKNRLSKTKSYNA